MSDPIREFLASQDRWEITEGSHELFSGRQNSDLMCVKHWSPDGDYEEKWGYDRWLPVPDRHLSQRARAVRMALAPPGK